MLKVFLIQIITKFVLKSLLKPNLTVKNAILELIKPCNEAIF